MFKEVPCIAIKLPVARVNDSKISDTKAKGQGHMGRLKFLLGGALYY